MIAPDQLEKKKSLATERSRKRRADPNNAAHDKAVRAAYYARPEVAEKRRQQMRDRFQRNNADPAWRERERKRISDWMKNNPEKRARQIRRAHLKKSFGISLEQFEEMLLDQNDQCGICAKEFSGQPSVDHDHATGKVRGLLCNLCNLMLGHSRDNLEILQRAIRYLEEHGC